MEGNNFMNEINEAEIGDEILKLELDKSLGQCNITQSLDQLSIIVKA